MPVDRKLHPVIAKIWKFTPLVFLAASGGAGLIAVAALPIASYPTLRTRQATVPPSVGQTHKRILLQRQNVARSISLLKMGVRNRITPTSSPSPSSSLPPTSPTSHPTLHNYIDAANVILSVIAPAPQDKNSQSVR